MVNVVCQSDESFSMRNNDDRHFALHRLQGFSDLDFTGHVDLAGRLVQNENLRVAQYRSGESNSLALSTAESLPRLTYDGFVAVA